MSDPNDPSQPLRNPPGARRRGRRARALPAGASTEATPAPGAAPPASPQPRDAKAVAREEQKAESGPSRGMVCPRCGKYHDITNRSVGSDFECKCGATLTIPPLRQAPAARPPEITLRQRELRTRNRLSLVSMIVAFAAGIALLAAALYLLVTERSYLSGTCAGIACLAFLTVAVVATSEWRRTTAELASEATSG